MIEPIFRERILQELVRIEQEHQVRIVYACESGSRAWGFPSKDSDYDVRFIYVRELDWYLSIFDRRDVIEEPVSNMLDMNGWDLRKALNLFRKSNPPLLEWLQSPIPYIEKFSVAEQIRGISPLTFSPKSCMYHYLNMAKGNYRDYLQGEKVRIKKYFYVLRPLLACGWIEKYNMMPPMLFSELTDDLLQKQTELYDAVQTLLERKMAGDELDVELRIHPINEYLEQQLAHFERTANHMAGGENQELDQRLDDLFRTALREVWEA